MTEERMPQVLIADDEQNIRRVLSAILRRAGFATRAVGDGNEALEVLRSGEVFDALVTDLKMPKLDGMALLRQVKEEFDELPVVMITAHGSVNSAVEAVKLGAFDYIEKPFEDRAIRSIVTKAVAHRQAAREHAKPALDAENGRYGLIGTGPAMQEIFNIIDRVAATPSTVLITGESGTGKELVAKALHEQSDRAEEPFIKINCAAIPETLIESELFGHEKGAFTGAVSSKPGRFELADKGTLLLDEVGEIPSSMQVKLLRALQESEFERVGGIKTVRVDVRLIAATNANLLEVTQQGSFREDLYYRLNVVPIRIPPLRERQEDIPLLVRHFLLRFKAKLGKHVEGLSEEAMSRLCSHHWPGNIRELENFLERTLLFCDSPVIHVGDLPEDIGRSVRDTAPFPVSPPPTLMGQATPSAPPEDSRATAPVPAKAQGPDDGSSGVAPPSTFSTRELGVPPSEDQGTPRTPQRETPSQPMSGSLKEAVRVETVRVEREMILRALDETGGNVTRAAKLLQISRKSLQIKMKELGLRRMDEGCGARGSGDPWDGDPGPGEGET